MSKKLSQIVIAVSAICFLFSCEKSSKSTITETDETPQYTPCSTCHIYVAESIFTPANFGGASSADTICNSDSYKPNSGYYKAIIMDNTRNQSTDWVLKANQDYYQADGVTLVGTTNSNRVFPLFSGGYSLSNVISYNPGYAWTGIEIASDTSWVLSSNNCSNWTSTNSGGSGSVGTTVDVTKSVFEDRLLNCDNSMTALYCVEQ